MRVLLDTNVFVGALLSAGGNNRQVIRACLLGHAVPVFGAALLHEYEDLLGRDSLMKKSPLGLKERNSLFDSLLSVAVWVKVYYLWRPNLPDEGDNHLIELALAGGADMIVTNNVRDLIHSELAFPHLRILTPFQFLEAIPWQP
jgi:putative PIN family toxin of toxin-antitoxin system